MTSQNAINEFDRLLDLLSKSAAERLGVIPWAQPVPAFGSPRRSRVATLGLNPSNLEFEDDDGIPLVEPLNRFETLQTLRLSDWKARTADEARRAWLSCEEYFLNRPYHRWFRPLDRVLHRLGHSYYCQFASACHLDLVPFATKEKWSGLDQSKKSELLTLGADALVRTLRDSTVDVLVLNGASVVKAFQELTGHSFHVEEMPSWSLRRGNSADVRGFAYRASIHSLGGHSLDKELLVLGYNHNIQSSFGVRSDVIEEIGKWVAQCGNDELA